MDSGNVLMTIRRTNVSWILKYLLAITSGASHVTIEEKPECTKYYCLATDRTVILHTEKDHHLIHFMKGTQDFHTEFFSLSVDFNCVVTVPAELIIKYLCAGIDKRRTIEWLKILKELKE